MKKFVFVLVLMGLLSGCNAVEETTIISPNGFPGIAHVMIELEDDYLEVERVSGPQVLVASFTSESHDIIVAPITMGTAMYNQGMPYQLVKVLTYGNLYFISEEPIHSLSDLIGLDVVSFGENTVNEMILTKVTEHDEVVINYRATSLQESYLQFVQGNADVAVVAEPVLTQAKAQFDDLYVIDIGAIYEDQVGEVFPQAGIFVHENVDNTTLNYYLTQLQASIDAMFDDSYEYAVIAESLGHPFEVTVLSDAIASGGVGLINPHDFTQFYSFLMDFDPSMIGNKLPDDGFYRDSK